MEQANQMWDIETTEAQFTDLTNQVLRHVLQLRETDWRYGHVQDSLLRELMLPSLTVETLMPTLVAVLKDFYEPRLSGSFDAHGVLFRRGYRLANVHNWEKLMYDVCVVDSPRPGALKSKQYQDDEWFCLKALGETHLASGLAPLFTAVALFLSNLTANVAHVQQGDEEWLWRLQALLAWFDEVCVATHPELDQSFTVAR